MAEQYVPDDIREFILEHIASVAQIEALLLIWSSPGERWGVPRIAARIYTSELVAATALDALCAQGLLACRDGVFALNASPQDTRMIRSLHDVYTRHLIPVTDVIHSKSRNAGLATPARHHFESADDDGRDPWRKSATLTSRGPR
jgi:hypothetical protein